MNSPRNLSIDQLLAEAAADPQLREALARDRDQALSAWRATLSPGDQALLAAIPQQHLCAMLEHLAGVHQAVSPSGSQPMASAENDPDPDQQRDDLRRETITTGIRPEYLETAVRLVDASPVVQGVRPEKATGAVRGTRPALVLLAAAAATSALVGGALLLTHGSRPDLPEAPVAVPSKSQGDGGADGGGADAR